MNTQFIGDTSLASKHEEKVDKNISLLNVPCNQHFNIVLYI